MLADLSKLPMDGSGMIHRSGPMTPTSIYVICFHGRNTSTVKFVPFSVFFFYFIKFTPSVPSSVTFPL